MATSSTGVKPQIFNLFGNWKLFSNIKFLESRGFGLPNVSLASPALPFPLDCKKVVRVATCYIKTGVDA